MDYTPITLHLPSHVILDMVWIQVGVDLEIQLTAYPQDFGVFILPNAGLVIKFRLYFNFLPLMRYTCTSNNKFSLKLIQL